MKLRDYQLASVDSIFSYFDSGKRGNPLVALPTGTGKSLVIAEFIKNAYKLYPGQRFIQLTHVKELIEQNHKTLRRIWPSAPAGVYSAGLNQRQAHFPITFAGIASVVNSPDLFGRIDLAFIDEAHLVAPKDGTMYQKFLNSLRTVNPHLKVIGFTATQFRLGQGLLTEENGLFTDVCFDMTRLESFNWFIQEGYLIPLVPKQTYAELNVDNVRIQAGEYVQKDLQEAVDKLEVTSRVLDETIACAGDRQHWLIFAAGVQHAIHIRDMLVNRGIGATVVHSKLDSKQRDEAISGFRKGKYRAIVNNGILTTGFDYPEIDLIVMLRPTQSPGLWVQMLGRGTRPVYTEGFNLEFRDGRLGAIAASQKKNCLVLDFAGNTRRLGPVNDPMIPRRRGKGNGPGVAPVKLCEVCRTYNHSSAKFCFNCGAEFKIALKFGPGASTQELIAKTALKTTVFDVDRVTYQLHKKQDRPNSMKVSYFCGLRMFQEYICLEHDGYARKRARDWWRDRSGLIDPPENINEALTRLQELKVPRRIRVWINKQHPEILGYEFNH